MRIQHNIMAMNSYRNFSNNTSKLSKNLEKLSSGYRINRAGDDAAGLAISEKMRAQISGLEQAQSNAKSGVNLVQTAEGALTEVHDMLNRMVTLSEQSANGTFDNEVDRANLQKEFDQLRSEIDRIADSSNFNGINLLDGSLAKSDASSISTAQQMKTITATTDNTVITGQGYKDAEGAITTFTSTAIKGSNVNYDVYEFNFTDKDGNNHTLQLLEGALAGALATNASVAAAINAAGTSGAVLSFNPAGTDQDKALAAFKETFKVTGDADGLHFQVKDPAGKGALTGLKKGGATATNTALTSLAAKTGTTTGAVKAGYELTYNTGVRMVAGDTLTIGDKTFEFVAAGGTPTTKGATAVTVGANNAAGDKANLLAALQEAGYEVESTSTGLRFTDPSQLTERQEGAQVETSSDSLRLDNQEAQKQKTTIAVNGNLTGAGGNTATLTVNYVDADGKAQSKQISFDASGASAALDGTAMAEALSKDADLSQLFDIGNDGAGNITITSKSLDSSVSQLGSISTNAGSSTITPTLTDAAKDAGKTLGLKDPVNGNLKAGDTITVNGKTYEFATDSTAEIGKDSTRVLLGSDGVKSMENLSKALSADGIKHNFDAATGTITMADKNNAMEAGGGLTLQIGDTSDSFNQLTVSIEDMHAASLGIADIDIGTQKGAQDAVKVIKDAINSVSSTRGTLGATQNRLDHTINNLSVMQENIQDAESTIRDVDVAKEMMDYTKNNILVQSAQAMLAQANQVPQGVLQLLQ